MTKNIKAILRDAAAAYYEGNPTMSDREFDRLAKVAEFDEVGFNSRDNRTPHAFPMFSLQKVFTNEVEKNPLNDYKGATVVSPKLDGAAVSLLYIEGLLHRALTRGDGTKGLDITELMIHLVPEYIVPHSSVQQITGEVVAPKTIKNSRNYAAGALNLKDPAEFQTRELKFIAYSVQPAMSETLTTDLGMLSRQGFSTVIESRWSEYPDDGVVFRVDNYIDFERMGYTSHHPRGAFALKSIQTGVNTKLLDVIWNVGKSGVVAPTAILEPVEIDGANVSRATLHNMRYITDLNLEIGCTVEVIRSGEIIPKIVRRVD
tara:strand:- start:109 stop:1059 length:951 start_codon:yes stop_codon:yes gene_type:complete